MAKRRKTRGNRRGRVLSAQEYQAQIERLKDESGLVGYTETPWSDRRNTNLAGTSVAGSPLPLPEKIDLSNSRLSTSIDFSPSTSFAEDTLNVSIQPENRSRNLRSTEAESIAKAKELHAVDDLVQCIFCGDKIMQRDLRKHLESKHHQVGTQKSNTSVAKQEIPPTHVFSQSKPLINVAVSHVSHESKRNGMTRCPVCNQPVRNDRLEKHVSKVHLDKEQQQKQVDSSGFSPESVEDETSHTQDSVEQAYFDTRFAEKYLGIYRRENSGRFGSIPLYDDYNEEGDID